MTQRRIPESSGEVTLKTEGSGIAGDDNLVAINTVRFGGNYEGLYTGSIRTQGGINTPISTFGSVTISSTQYTFTYDVFFGRLGGGIGSTEFADFVNLFVSAYPQSYDTTLSLKFSLDVRSPYKGRDEYTPSLPLTYTAQTTFTPFSAGREHKFDAPNGVYNMAGKRVFGAPGGELYLGLQIQTPNGGAPTTTFDSFRVSYDAGYASAQVGEPVEFTIS